MPADSSVESELQLRYYLIAAGVAEYPNLDADEQLPSVVTDLDLITDLFIEELGYERALPELAHNPTAPTLGRTLEAWFQSDKRTASDAVVLYYSGHGETSDLGEHYLLTTDYQPKLYTTAFATESLARLLLHSPVRHLLFMLDTCYSGQGIQDFSSVAARVASLLVGARTSLAGIYTMAAALSRQVAEQGLFARALVQAVHDPRFGGTTQAYLHPDSLIGAINERLPPQQAASGMSANVRGEPRLIRNPRFEAAAQPGLDIDSQRALGANPMELRTHWMPRARGVEVESEPGWYFTGRVTALRELMSWLHAPSGDGLGRVVTGRPGSGKSALLSRVVTLSDPAIRRQAPLAHVAPDTLPRERLIDVAIHAKGKTLREVVAAIARAAGVQAELPMHSQGSDADALIALLYQHESQLVIVLDALDEAVDPLPIARDVLDPLAGLAGVRLLVGTRAEYVPALGARFKPIDLDADGYVDRSDLAEYARRLLSAESASASALYRADPKLTYRVAQAVATSAFPVFLVARILCHNLLQRDQVVDITAPGWEMRLPTTVGGAFDEYLRRFKDNEQRARDLMVPLACAEGAGLPWENIWLPLANAIAHRGYTDDDIAWLLGSAGAYIIEDQLDGRSVYRLYHQALADHIKSGVSHPADPDSRFASALWTHGFEPYAENAPSAAPPRYVRRHLATHLERAGLLPRLHDLLNRHGPDGTNLWYEHRALLGEVREYLEDITRARRAAAHATEQDLRRVGTGLHVHLEVLYGLIESSLSSLGGRLPVELITALAVRGVRPPAQMLDFARSLPQGDLAQSFQKLDVLKQLAITMQEPISTQCLDSAMAMVRDSTPEDRARFTGVLASALSERHLRDAITLAQELSARDQREQALAVLTRRLVELGHVSDALHTVATLSDASASDALRLMAPAVPASDVNAAAELAQTLTEPSSRDSALAAMAVRAASVRKSAEAFAWLRSLTEQRYAAEALCSMAPHLDAEETSRALDIAASLGSIGDRTSALACLAQNLDEPSRTSVLQSLLERVSRPSTRESERALAGLVAYLPRSMVQRLTWSFSDEVRTNAHVRLAELGDCVEVLGAVQGLKYDGGKETIIARIVPFLNEACLERAMTVATDMSDSNLQAATLRRLLPRMAELGRPHDALRRALAMDTEYWRSGAVSGIAPYLDVPGLREALSSAQRIRDDAAQQWAAVQLSVFAPATLLGEALEIIETGGLTGTQLVFAAERFRQYTSSAHLGEVFAAVLRIPNDRDRTSALLRLAHSLGPSERDQAAESVLELDLPPLTEPDALLIKALREPLRGRAAAAISRSAWDWSRSADREFEPAMVASFAGTLGALGASMQVLNELRICDERIRILGLIRVAKYLGGQRNAEAIEHVLEMLSRMVSPYDVVITVGEVAEDAPEPVVRAALEVAHTRCDTGTVTTERCYLSARLASFGAADEALALLQTISDAGDEVKPRALTRVARYLRGARRTEVLREAALAAARIRNPTAAGGPQMRRAEVLAPLAELLADVPLTDSHAILGDVLSRLSQQARPEFLADLGALAPVIFAIGHTQGIENVRTAMRQTAGWWP